MVAGLNHPILTPLQPEIERRLRLAGKAELVEHYEKRRQQLILLANHDPLRYGYEPEIWKKADQQEAELRQIFPSGVTHLVNLGGNRASKTYRAAKRIVQHMVRNPDPSVNVH